VRERYDSLADLARHLQVRAYRLIPLIQTSRPPVTGEDDRTVAYVTIEAMNAWASFSRAFYVSSALRAYNAKGTRITITAAGLQTPDDAVLLATKRLKSNFKGAKVARRQEPAWHDVNNLITLLQHVGASNAGVAVAAFGYSTKVFTCLPALRNFFAHRNEDTCTRCTAIAATIPVPPSRRPADILLHRDLAKPMNVLSEWITDMTHVADQLVQ
jgi:hypothetical protein